MQQSNEDVKAYRLGKLTILQWMAILALLGVAAAWVSRTFFG